MVNIRGNDTVRGPRCDRWISQKGGPTHGYISSVSAIRRIDPGNVRRPGPCPPDDAKDEACAPTHRHVARRRHDRRSDHGDRGPVRAREDRSCLAQHDPRRPELLLGGLHLRRRGGMAGPVPAVQAGPAQAIAHCSAPAHPTADVARVLELLKSRSESWTGGRLYAMAATAAYTALRRDELLWLQCQDIDLPAGLLHVVERRRLKTLASAGVVPIAADLAGILAAWEPRCGSPWLFPGVRRRDRPWTGGASGHARATDSARPAGRLESTGSPLRVSAIPGRPGRDGAGDFRISTSWPSCVIPRRATQRFYLHADPDPSAIVRAMRRVNYRVP